MKERQGENWDEQTYLDGWDQPKLKFIMEKATNKDAFKKYREREAAETTGQVGNIKRHTGEQKLCHY